MCVVIRCFYHEKLYDSDLFGKNAFLIDVDRYRTSRDILRKPLGPRIVKVAPYDIIIVAFE